MRQGRNGVDGFWAPSITRRLTFIIFVGVDLVTGIPSGENICWGADYRLWGNRLSMLTCMVCIMHCDRAPCVL